MNAHANHPFPLYVGVRESVHPGWPVFDQNGWCRGWGATPALAGALAEDIEDGRVNSPILDPVLYIS